ncbi:FMRFamide receptor-like [Dreissena polymorpha]|uniref:G-protein coupled receptors family 1 profile domain-containing protein n=1 Tax=Dreissena polymorpha TaxID=45954 RepID=A0A9D4LTR9_DREPO|nr:FMRFamide receptor-like [Dreissena polymorpha]KAH3863634.1 hypothetical protein DPMN_026622 [Dreissena polymorpha]
MPVSELNLQVNLSVGGVPFKQDKQLMFVFWGIILPVIGSFGLIGNILNIIVLFRREMKSTTVYFLRTLVLTDTGIIVGCILGLSSISITQLHPDNPAMNYYTHVIYPHMFTPINFIVMALQFTNVWVTVAVTIERYIAICHPFSAIYVCNRRNTFILIGCICVIAIAYNIPRCFATKVTECDNRTECVTSCVGNRSDFCSGVTTNFTACDNITDCVTSRDGNKRDCRSLVTTDLGKTEWYEQYYSVYAYMIIIYIVPLVILLILNLFLIIELMRMRMRRSASSMLPTPNENSETNMSIVLILIVVIFILCQTPGLVAQFWFLDQDVLTKWLCVSNTLFALNSSVNIIIYTAVGRKFRTELLTIFRLRAKGKRNRGARNGAPELATLMNMPVYASKR